MPAPPVPTFSREPLVDGPMDREDSLGDHSMLEEGGASLLLLRDGPCPSSGHARGLMTEEGGPRRKRGLSIAAGLVGLAALVVVAVLAVHGPMHQARSPARRSAISVVELLPAGDAALMGAPQAEFLVGQAGPPFDCDKGLDTWEMTWSQEQADFCCANMGRGCQAESTSEAGSTSGAPPETTSSDAGSAGSTSVSAPPAPPAGNASEMNPDDIVPCAYGEPNPCPGEWAFSETGGYYCPKTGGCSAWPTYFPEAACPDQCSIGNTPTTSTSTITSTTVTTTYAGQGITLFCWSMCRPGYEIDIMHRCMEIHAGIFACDDQLVLSNTDLTISVNGQSVSTLVIPKVEAGWSKDGTAANSEQFMKAWAAIRDDGRYKDYDWTVKLDPDAVLLADRLRMHLNPFNGGNHYIRNCDKPMSEGTMMFGSMEAISKQALVTYFANFDKCAHDIPWQAWGEDLFLMRCLESLGVAPVGDFDLVQDGVCKGVWCGHNWAAAFHPMKSVDAWESCWKQAIAAR